MAPTIGVTVFRPIRILFYFIAFLTCNRELPAAAGDGLSPDPLRYVAPSRGFDTIHTSLDLDIDLESRSIAGSVTHTMRSLRTGLDRFELNCVELEVESVTIDGEPVEYQYPVPGAMATSWIGGIESKRADDRLVITPPAPLDYGREFTVTVAYRGTPQRGLYWIRPEKGIPEKRYEVWAQGEGEDNRYWIPCHDYPDDVATYEGRFRVREGYFALSNGDLVSQRPVDGGRTEYHWRLDTPQVSYLIMVAVARYDVHEEEGPGGVKVMYVVPPGTDRQTIERGYGRTGDMIDFFNRAIGIDYPYGKYAQVVVQNFIYGGMENTTATVMNDRTLFDESAGLTKTEDYLVAHELAHQWWGDMVTCREWSHMWLNEGFSTYYADLYREYHEGDDAFRYQMLERHRDVAGKDNAEPRPMVTEFYNRTGARNNFNVYQKGSSVLHMLRFLLGDEDYARAVKLYGDRHRHSVVDTGDFARAVRDATGRNLDWFFEQWVYLAGHPKFRVSSNWDPERGTLALSVRQIQATGGIVPLFRVPLDVEITTDTGKEIHRIVADAESQEFFFDCASRPRMVIFDKGDWNLKELDFPRPEGELLYQLEHGDYIERVRAAEALGSMPASAAVISALHSVLLAGGHYGLRQEAAAALGRLGTPESMQAVIEGLGAKDARVRLACAGTLGEFNGESQAARALTDRFEKDAASEVRSKAVESLVKIRADNAGEVCRDALDTDSNEDIIRRAGLTGLAALGDTDALATIARYAGPGNRRDYRHEAIIAYSKLARDLSDSRRRDATTFLAGMLDDWYLKTRQEVIAALQRVGHPSAIKPLERVARTDPLERMRGRAQRTADHIRSSDRKSVSIEEIENRIEELERRLETLGKELQ
jgi:aminopeptidase N